MDDYIEINIPVLKTDTEQIMDEVAKIREEMERMFEEIAELDAMWDGPANLAFKQQFLNDYQLMNSLCTAVDRIIAYSDHARAEYYNCENAVSTAIEEICI